MKHLLTFFALFMLVTASLADNPNVIEIGYELRTPGDDNELTHEERIKSVTSAIPSFTSGHRLTLPKCSLNVISWEIASD